MLSIPPLFKSSSSVSLLIQQSKLPFHLWSEASHLPLRAFGRTIEVKGEAMLADGERDSDGKRNEALVLAVKLHCRSYH
jgi:hypothetical protein